MTLVGLNFGPGKSRSIYLGSTNISKVYKGDVEFGASEDWDTYEDGINIKTGSTSGFDVWSKESVSYTGSTGIIQWGRNGTEYGYRYSTTAQADNAAPYVALWDINNEVWVGYYAKYQMNWFGTNNGAMYVPTTDFVSSGDRRYVLVFLSQEPTNFANWRDYDGPVDWMVYEDGVYLRYPDTAPESVDELVHSGTLFTKTYEPLPRLDLLSSGLRAWYTLENKSILYAGTSGAAVVPYYAIWLDGNWGVYKWNGFTNYQNRYKHYSGYNWSTGTSGPFASNRIVVVQMFKDPGDISGWSDYDGDMSAWESIDTSLLTYSSSNTLWNIDQTVTTWSRSGDAFGDLDYIDHNGTNMVLRVNNGTRFASLQDYIDEYEVPTFWVWINGVRYIFDTFDQVTASGDLRLIGPAISLADFQDSGSGSNSLGWTSGMSVLCEFRPEWDTFYPRVGLVAGDNSSAAGRMDASYAVGSVFENVVTGADNFGVLKPSEFLRFGGTTFALDATGVGTYDTNAIRPISEWAVYWRDPANYHAEKGFFSSYGTNSQLRYQNQHWTLDYNSFASRTPVGCVIYGRDPGDVLQWAAYDGPEYDYDTYEVHNWYDFNFDTNVQDWERIPITNTGSGYTTNIVGSGLIGYSNPLFYCPSVGYSGDRAAIYPNIPDSAFVHHWSTNAGSGAYSSAGGWYAFGKPTTSPTGGGGTPYDVLQYSNDPEGGFRGSTGSTHLMTSSKGGEKAKYWARPYPKDGLIMFLPFKQMGSTYNYRTDAGSTYIIAGEQYNFPYPENFYIPYYGFVFAGNRILIQFTGTSANQTANKTDFLARVGGNGATCTVRLRNGTTSNTTVSIPTEYTYTGTWGTWTTTAVSLTLSNPSSGAPFNWTNYNDGTSEFLLPFPCAIRIEE